MSEAVALMYINGRDNNTVNKLCKKMSVKGYHFVPTAFDVTDIQAIDSSLDSLLEPPSILVNNAALDTEIQSRLFYTMTLQR